MSQSLTPQPELPGEARAQEILRAYQAAGFCRTDRMFAALLALQWLAGVALAVWTTPLSWAGAEASVHPHVWAAVFFGGLLSALPIYLVFTLPGQSVTRLCIAVAQMLWSALFVHLTGGRIETHFHVFGSLAFLAFYRDWRVLVTATLVTLVEHTLRGVFWPLSVFGTTEPSLWRAMEHVGWVLFEDVFLLICVRQRRNELTAVAQRQAWQEQVQAWTDNEIQHRTRQLVAKQAELAAIHDASPLGMFLCDASGKCTYVNRMTSEIIGLCPEDCLNEGWMRTIHPDDLAPMLADWEAAFKVMNRFSRAHRVVHPTGQLVWVNVTSSPIVQDKEVIGYVGTVEDITLQRRADDQLQATWRMLKLTLDALPMRVVILDGQGRIAAVNAVYDAFARDRGALPDDLVVGSDYLALCNRLYDSNDQVCCPVVAAIRQVLTGERHICELEYHQVCRGETRWFHTYIARISGESEPLLLVSHQDVTDRVHFAQELRDAKEAAQAANCAKSAFLANMSHELRTPMAAILGFIDILIASLSRAENIQAAQTIQRNAEYLLQLINDILDLSKVESGKLEAESIAVSPQELLQEVVSLMEVRAAAKNLLLRLEFASVLPQTIHTDPLRLRQVLVNLLGNAIKFTEVGEVRLVVKLWQQPGQSPRLRMEVRDTGVGLSESQLERLFQPFTQADSSITRKYGGTGLGLTISKRLTQLLGGDIEVLSRPGEGSVFVVTIETGSLANVALVLPETAVADTVQNIAPTVACQGMRLLLAEDGPDNQRLIAFLFRKAGAEVVVVDNGQQAIDAALAAESGDRSFDVVLMDMQMPVLDGYSATKLLRARGYVRPIVALTAHAMSGDREVCLTAGCNEYATKPIQRDLLLALVAKYSVCEQGAGA